MSPVSAYLKAWTTNSTASSRLIKNLVISGSVIVNGSPLLIFSINNGITEPRDAITLPYLVPQINVWSLSTFLDLATNTFSIIAFEMPIALIGYAALSVDKQITFFTFSLIALCKTFSVPKILVFTASIGKNSHEGTCFNAAA